MAGDQTFALPGSTRRKTQFLSILALFGESYATELSRVLNMSVQAAQNFALEFERGGVIYRRPEASRVWFVLNPAHFAYKELVAHLLTYADRDPEVIEAADYLERRRIKKGYPVTRLPRP